LFYSHRCGQPHSSHIDWKIAALDGLGLFLFFVPGVIAFVVDFYTGAIYLPADEYYPASGASAAKRSSPPPANGLHRVAIAPEDLRQERIEQIVADHVGRPVSLADNQTRLSRLPDLDRFGEQLRRHEADRTFGVGVERIGFKAA
jgi:hypothetical protein